jgi:hypothetical protein
MEVSPAALASFARQRAEGPVTGEINSQMNNGQD